MKRILVAGGGTGGHIAPALAVGRRISSEAWANVFYARTERPVDAVMYAVEGDMVHTLRSPRIDSGARLLLPVTGTAAVIRAARLLRRLGINAVLGTGGYASFYAVAAARIMGLPGAVLDTNAIPGRSNRWVSHFCDMAFAAFPGQESMFHCPVKAVGIPLQPGVSRPGARERLGISPGEKVVLFLGGSQGARALNDLAAGCPQGIRVLLQCGERDEERVSRLLQDRSGFITAGFVNDLSDWYSSADLAVARAGAQTLAELSAFGVPSVFVPYPHAADDHQAANAMVAVNAGAARMVRQGSLDASEFWALLVALLNDTVALSRMAGSMKGLLPADAAERVSSEMRRLCG